MATQCVFLTGRRWQDAVGLWDKCFWGETKMLRVSSDISAADNVTLAEGWRQQSLYYLLIDKNTASITLVYMDRFLSFGFRSFWLWISSAVYVLETFSMKSCVTCTFYCIYRRQRLFGTVAAVIALLSVKQSNDNICLLSSLKRRWWAQETSLSGGGALIRCMTLLPLPPRRCKKM